jgi:inosine-uridine nucleoside N-ribohydrolase
VTRAVISSWTKGGTPVIPSAEVVVTLVGLNITFQVLNTTKYYHTIRIISNTLSNEIASVLHGPSFCNKPAAIASSTFSHGTAS